MNERSSWSHFAHSHFFWVVQTDTSVPRNLEIHMKNKNSSISTKSGQNWRAIFFNSSYTTFFYVYLYDFEMKIAVYMNFKMLSIYFFIRRLLIALNKYFCHLVFHLPMGEGCDQVWAKLVQLFWWKSWNVTSL